MNNHEPQSNTAVAGHVGRPVFDDLESGTSVEQRPQRTSIENLPLTERILSGIAMTSGVLQVSFNSADFRENVSVSWGFSLAYDRFRGLKVLDFNTD
jgi:hypothetical protein